MKQLLRNLALRLRAGLRLHLSRRAGLRHRRVWFESLEERSLLAQLINVGTATDVVYNLPATGSTAFLEDDGTGGNGTLQLRGSGFDVTPFANPTGSLTINRGNSARSITIAALPDFTAGLTVGSPSAPLASITIAGTVALGVDKGFTAFAAGTIRLSTSLSDITTSGTGAISLTTARDISLADGSSIITDNGSLALTANQQATPTTGDFYGVWLVGARVEAKGAGAVTVQGKGGNDSGGFQHGVNIRSGSIVQGGNGGLQLIGQGVGAGAASLNVGVLVDSSVVSAAGNGSVTVRGFGGVGTGGSNDGVWVNNAGSLITSSGGNVLVAGQAGTGGTSSSEGVQVYDGGQISAGGGGTVTVQGTGGNGTNLGNMGVTVTSNSTIASSGGDVLITGQGGGSGSSTFNVGVYVSSSQVSAVGSGLLTVNGTGGNASGDMNHGVMVTGTGSAIKSDSGNVQTTGVGRGTGGSGNTTGVLVTSGGQILAGGTGAVTVQGTGGSGSGANNLGVGVSLAGSSITSNGGNVEVIGIEWAGSSGISISNSGGTIAATNGGSLTLVGNSLSLENSGGISANATTLRPYTSNVGINLGTANNTTGGPLGLTDAELDKVTAGTITIGSATSGTITVSADITRAAATNINLISGGAIDLNSGLINTVNGNLSLTPGNAATAKATKAGIDLNLSNAGILSFGSGSDLAFAINGTAVDTQYQQLNVAGGIDLTGVDLVLNGSYTPAIGNAFVLIKNDGTDAVIGTFNGLPENSLLIIPTGTQAGSYQITYQGGDGNDVVLTSNNADPVMSGTAGNDNWLVKRNGASTEVTLNGSLRYSIPADALATLTVNALTGNDTLTVDLSGGRAIEC